MPLRLIELITEADPDVDIAALVEREHVLGAWQDAAPEGGSRIRILLDSQITEQLTDQLEEKFSNGEGFRLLLSAVEATVPRPEPPEEQREAQQDGDGDSQPTHDRISREELYEDVAAGAQVSWIYLALVLLSTIVAAFGLAHGDVATLVGAMVIAPLLGPNVALALATTLGDWRLALRSLRTGAAGLGASLAAAFFLGTVIPVDADSEEIIRRAYVGLPHIALALAAGAAGALAFSRGESGVLIGVMVAVALVPPLVNCGLLAGAGRWPESLSAGVLVLTNLIAINLAGVLAFSLQGIRPKAFYEVDRARRATIVAISVWVGLLVLLALVIAFLVPNFGVG